MTKVLHLLVTLLLGFLCLATITLSVVEGKGLKGSSPTVTSYRRTLQGKGKGGGPPEGKGPSPEEEEEEEEEEETPGQGGGPPEGKGPPSSSSPEEGDDEDEDDICAEYKSNGTGAYGHCTAYCIAQECHVDPGNGNSCALLKEKFEDETDGAKLPCESTDVPETRNINDLETSSEDDEEKKTPEEPEEEPEVISVESDSDENNSTSVDTKSASKDSNSTDSADEFEFDAPPAAEEPAETETRTTTLDVTTPTKPESETFGDPHFKTWNAAKKFDYHGICDLVLLDHPTFENGLGLKIHIRTKRMKYASYIETVAVAIGQDTLEFSNDMKNFLINGKKIKAGSKPTLSGYEVRLFKKVISIRLGTKERQYNNDSHIDLAYRVTGFPKVKVVPRNPKTFEGSLGLLGQYPSGKMMGRDGTTEYTDPTEFALHWQVMSSSSEDKAEDKTNVDGPMIFSTFRYPQYPNKCIPPKKMLGKRLGDSHMKEAAAKACVASGDDYEQCVFDVMMTRSVDSADSVDDDDNEDDTSTIEAATA